MTKQLACAAPLWKQLSQQHPLFMLLDGVILLLGVTIVLLHFLPRTHSCSSLANLSSAILVVQAVPPYRRPGFKCKQRSSGASTAQTVLTNNAAPKTTTPAATADNHVIFLQTTMQSF